MFVKLTGRTCLIVGGGTLAEQKISSLLDTGARVHVVALDATKTVRGWADAGRIDFTLRAFADHDLDGVFLVVVAAQSADLNRHIFHEAERRGVLCNVVDVPELCAFYYPALVRRGDLQIAISTAGHSPSLARQIRIKLERQYGPEYADWVAELGVTRKLVLASDLSRERKLELLHSLASRAALEAALSKAPELTTKGSAT
jgi:precorrin-2 dehydrogenase/sirohydrochlorin ferrochelatase